MLVFCKAIKCDISLLTWPRRQVINFPIGLTSTCQKSGRFKRFREASDLDKKSEQKQVSSLIFVMGDEVEDIPDSFRLSDNERKSHATVRDKFKAHFVKKRNIVFDRASFFQRRQEEGEPVAFFCQ